MDRKVKICLKELVKERGISLRELARLSDIEPSIINKLANGKREKIYLPHIERIADALDIDDISKIIKLVSEED
ncbi:helix-turn-helix domain-containing protein [Enterococcus quebecensis]|uniref:Transcriptional regulator n=1 Tax=Enterococcus quebecensis TaxID=903983 RepID=A0A1E5GPQ4_9ENTE|nr:helix-turn-helix transcriptional regulator [Enterococcus quebecensis]OEG14691.1 transcriptional regulator [Enterococcus quebecensis]OJG73256.1 Cro/CI family transcriptional regulator [Enterococcus quebecensis]